MLGGGAGAGGAKLCPRVGPVPAGAGTGGLCRDLQGCVGEAGAASCAAACPAVRAAQASMTAGSAAGAAAVRGPGRAAALPAPGSAPSTRRIRRFSRRRAASLPASCEAILSRYALSELYSGRPASIMPRMCSSRDGSHIPDSAISRTSSALYWGATRGARNGSIYCYRAAPGGARWRRLSARTCGGSRAGCRRQACRRRCRAAWRGGRALPRCSVLAR